VLVDFRRDYTEQEVLQKTFGLPIEFAPGSQWSYSDSGYVVLGPLIHNVAGKFYGDFLQERVFRPLGMSSTRVISEADIVPGRAAGYRLDNGALKNQEWVAPSLNTTADGGLYSTVLDMAKWDIALSGEVILKRSSLAQMWTPVRLEKGATYPYGFGWGVREQRGHTVIEHGGYWQGFRAYISRYVDDQLSVIVLANLADAPVWVIAHTAAGLLQPDLALPDARAPRVDPTPQRVPMLKETLAAWGSYRSSPTMGAGLRGAWSGTAEEVSDRRQTRDRLAKLQTFDFLAEDDVKERHYERRGELIRRILYYGTRAGDEVGLYRFYLTETDGVADFAWSVSP
jgi:CubicO group peptidase (beta-lactamase class C family)